METKYNYDKYTVLSKPQNIVGSRVVCIICPARSDQRGDRFVSSLKWAIKHFRNIDIYLADTLDIHNFIGRGQSRYGAQISAIARGDDWLLQNYGVLQQVFGDNYTLTRWTNIQKRPDFNARHQLICNLYANNPKVRMAIDTVCAKHLHEVQARGKAIDTDSFLRSSVAYMCEEIAGLAEIHAFNPAPEIYSGTIFEDSSFFQKQNTLRPELNLTLPSVIQISFQKQNTTRDTMLKNAC